LKPEPRRCIYVARKPGDGRPSEVKVGTTDDLPRRMKQLGLVPMTAWWGTFEEEHELHGWLRRDRLHGEWFVYTERTERTVDTWALEPDPDGLLLLVLAEPENARARWLAPRREEAKRRREAASKAEAA
jgi:hypothetical protein